MRHVWIINHYAQEPGGAGGTRHFHLAEYLSLYGWRTTIIAASVDSVSGCQRLKKGECKRLEVIHNISFLWIRTPQYSGNGLGRIFNMLTFTWRLLNRKIIEGLPVPNLIVGSSVHPFAALAGAFLASRFNVPFVFEVRDLWPQTLIDIGRLQRSSLMAWALRKLELWLYKRAVRVVVLLPEARRYIVPLGIPSQKVIWIPNGVDLSLFPPPSDPVQKEIFTILYLGSHGQANALGIVLQAMRLVQDSVGGSKIILRMVGDGPHKLALMTQASDLDLKNVFFEAPVPKRQIPDLASQADAFILSVLDLPNLYKYGISMNKIYDYLASSRPIIMASNAVNNPVKDAGAGISVVAGQPKLLAEAILKIAATPLEERISMGRAGRHYVEQNHDFARLSARMASVFEEACLEK